MQSKGFIVIHYWELIQSSNLQVLKNKICQLEIEKIKNKIIIFLISSWKQFIRLSPLKNRMTTTTKTHRPPKS